MQHNYLTTLTVQGELICTYLKKAFKSIKISKRAL